MAREPLDPVVQDTLIGEALLTALDEANCAVVVSDDDLNIVAVNRTFADLLGYSREELTTMTALDVTGRSDFREADAVYKKLREGDQVFEEALLRRKDGRIGRIKYRAMNGHLGRLPVLISITREISEFVLDPEPDG